MEEKQTRNNILLISLQGIGDLILTTSLLHVLKYNFPQVKISVLTFASNKSVLYDNPDIDEIITFDFKDRFNVFKMLSLLLSLRKRHFDLSICAYPSGLRSAFLGYLTGARQRFGQGLSLFKNYRWLFTKQVPIAEVKHAVLMNLDFVKLLGVETKDISAGLVFNINDEDRAFATKFLGENEVDDRDLVVAIHAGGGRYTAAYRSWPMERFAKVADELIEKFKAKVIFIGGKNDEGIVNNIIKMMKQKPINAVGRGSLKQIAALIQKARLLVCNNSAPMHIAAALGVPTVSIFGSADSRIHRPWGKNHIVLQKELECSPCYYPFFRDTLEETKAKNRWFGKRFKCVTDDYRCLISIAVEEVLEAINSALKAQSSR